MYTSAYYRPLIAAAAALSLASPLAATAATRVPKHHFSILSVSPPSPASSAITPSPAVTMAADTAAPTIALFAPAPPMGHSAATAALPTPPSSPDHHQRTALSSFSSSSSSSSSEAAPAGKADDNRRSLLKLAARPLDTPPVTPSASQLGLRALEAQQLAALNREFAQRSPLDILLWLQSSNLGNVVQFTSFGLSGMVITDLMAKLNYDVPIAFVDTLHHFEEVRGRRKRNLKEKGKVKYMSRHFPPLRFFFGSSPLLLFLLRVARP